MYNETKEHIKNFQPIKKSNKKLKVKLFDFDALNQTIKKVLGHDQYDTTMQQKLREEIIKHLNKEKICLYKGVVSSKALQYINGITANMDKFFQNENFK